jgi:hypothetical protein
MQSFRNVYVASIQAKLKRHRAISIELWKCSLETESVTSVNEGFQVQSCYASFQEDRLHSSFMMWQLKNARQCPSATWHRQSILYLALLSLANNCRKVTLFRPLVARWERASKIIILLAVEDQCQKNLEILDKVSTNFEFYSTKVLHRFSYFLFFTPYYFVTWNIVLQKTGIYTKK